MLWVVGAWGDVLGEVSRGWGGVGLLEMSKGFYLRVTIVFICLFMLDRFFFVIFFIGKRRKRDDIW